MAPMNAPTPHSVIDLAALVECINDVVRQPNRGYDAPNSVDMMGQAARRLNEHGHADVELLAVLSRFQSTKPGDSANPHAFVEGMAFALRHGATVVGRWGESDMEALTTRSQARRRDIMVGDMPPFTTRVVAGPEALGLVALLSPDHQAEINALVDRVLLEQEIIAPEASRSPSRM